MKNVPGKQVSRHCQLESHFQAMTLGPEPLAQVSEMSQQTGLMLKAGFSNRINFQNNQLEIQQQSVVIDRVLCASSSCP